VILIKKSDLFFPLLFLLFLNWNPSLAQSIGNSLDSTASDSSFVICNRIVITGNKKTHAKIILREMSFKEGDTIRSYNFNEALAWSKNRIFNTGLFVTVDLLVVDKESSYKDVLVVVKERWYYFPTPIFELADRNFNEWWQQRGHSLSRVNFGIFYVQKNVRGRNETLKAKGQLGFTKKVELFYYIPYINLRKNQRTGLNLELSYILNKQVAYRTTDYKLTYLDYNKFAREKFRVGPTFTYRKKFFQTHFLGSTFNYNRIADTIARLNPNYLLNGRTHQRYFSVEYDLVRDFRDVAYYPLKGMYGRLEIEKMGISVFHDINQLNIIGEYHLYRPISKKFFFAGSLKQKISVPRVQPFLQTQALGYLQDYVSGYELYVINGQHFSLAKVNFKYRLFAKQKQVSAIPINQFEQIPFALYIKAYTDAGYVVDNFNTNYLVQKQYQLANKFLIGGGIGLDLVSYYDFVMRMEYSINRLGQTGFYLHFGAGI